MKIKLTILAGLGAFALFAVASVAAPKPALNTIDSVKDIIVTQQDAYFQGNGKYFQGLPHKRGGKPHYQEEAWTDLVDLPVGLNFEVTVHQYETPKGEYGYQIVFENDSEIASFGYGPEAANRTYTWPKPIPII